ncbi:MAG: hypothetical protein ACE5IR_00385 [bacterium]
MKYEKIEVIEANQFVKKYERDIFRSHSIDYKTFLDKDTLKEHERQMTRLVAIW